MSVLFGYLLKYVIFCSRGDYTPVSPLLPPRALRPYRRGRGNLQVALDIEHMLIGKDKTGFERWRQSPQLRGMWALTAAVALPVAIGLGWMLAFSSGGTTGEAPIGFVVSFPPPQERERERCLTPSPHILPTPTVPTRARAGNPPPSPHERRQSSHGD